MKRNQTFNNDLIQAGNIVRLTQEKIDELASRNRMSDFPTTEGKVNKVYSSFWLPVLYINFGGQTRILPRRDVEKIN